ncbi:MAG: hypothetical protein JW829_07315 [Pirellulales bacterium]|nr:hypothetical protein [Pirellulales bacterium]
MKETRHKKLEIRTNERHEWINPYGVDHFVWTHDRNNTQTLEIKENGDVDYHEGGKWCGFVVGYVEDTGTYLNNGHLYISKRLWVDFAGDSEAYEYPYGVNPTQTVTNPQPRRRANSTPLTKTGAFFSGLGVGWKNLGSIVGLYSQEEVLAEARQLGITETDLAIAKGAGYIGIASGSLALGGGIAGSTTVKTVIGAAGSTKTGTVVLAGLGTAGTVYGLKDAAEQSYEAYQSFTNAESPLDYADAFGHAIVATTEVAGVGVGLRQLGKPILNNAKSAFAKPVRASVAPKRIADLAEANITNSGKTVLGHFPGYIDKAKARGASYFDIGDTWDTLSDAERWAANRHFLDKIANAGDKVLLSLPKTKIRPDSYLAKEIQYLINEKGYRWINQWSLGKP